MTGLYYDDIFLQHDTGFGHPERADRLRAIMKAFAGRPILNTQKIPTPSPAAKEKIAAVHNVGYVDSVLAGCEQAPLHLDSDTVVSKKSCEAALCAAGSAIDAVDRVMAGEIKNAFCAVRPPGHHAEIDRAMGFCLFNNIAITAQHLKDRHKLERIFVLDWDVHHGNGTQQAFYHDAQVLFLSLHQWPLYPGTGSPEETGASKGLGFTQNITFPPRTDAAKYLDTFHSVVDKIFSQFKPEFVLISAGFDAHVDDPLAELMLAEDDFAKMTKCVLENAATYSKGRVVSLLEGGYHLQALANSVHAHVSVLAGAK
jgi:acetoin utilization deacetylase AcuC-like enzyme